MKKQSSHAPFHHATYYPNNPFIIPLCITTTPNEPRRTPLPPFTANTQTFLTTLAYEHPRQRKMLANQSKQLTLTTKLNQLSDLDTALITQDR